MYLVILNLTAGGLSGGYRKYLQHLVPLLRDHPRVRKIEVFLPEPVAAAFPALEPVVRRYRPSGAYMAHSGLRQELCRLRPDVVFIPTAQWLDCGEVPVVSMVRNMEPLAIPFQGKSLLNGLKNLARAGLARRACRRSRRVIAVSNHVRDFLVGRWRLPEDRVGVVAHGIEPPVPAPQTVRPAALNGFEAKRFLFTAGSIRPARGLEDVLHALATQPPEVPTLPLVVAGEPDPDSRPYLKAMKQLAARLGLADRVLWTGRLGAAEMAWCFSRCTAFVMTSRAEACPNTALEAMNYGCHIVSTDHPPMPEFFQDAARYYRARDARSLAEQLRAALSADLQDQATFRERARRTAGRYTWQATADATAEQLDACRLRSGNAAGKRTTEQLTPHA